jgi:hypothetical protein
MGWILPEMGLHITTHTIIIVKPLVIIPPIKQNSTCVGSSCQDLPARAVLCRALEHYVFTI